MIFRRRGFLITAALMVWHLFRPRISLSGKVGALPGLSPLSNPEANKPASHRFKTIDYFLNESVNYDISFLWFKKAAAGSVTFGREGNGFFAALEAKTKGIVGFFTSHKKHRYVSHMTYVRKENRFRSTFFERYVTEGRKSEKTLSRLDYETRQVISTFFKNGEQVKETVEPIPLGVEYEDILSALYNVRIGYYGPLKAGRSFQLMTIPREGQSVIDVEIATPEEAKRRRFLFGRSASDTFLNANVRVPKEIFESKTGEVALLFDDSILPVHGIVKDYIGFGDVRATLLRPVKEGSVKKQA